MSETFRCPDCGAENPAGAEHCVQCNFPIAAHDRPGADARPARPAVTPPAAPAPSAEAGREAAPPAARSKAPLPRPLSRPPRRPRPGAMPHEAVHLWVWVGGIVAVLLIFMAVTWRRDIGRTVEGASPEQQQRADQLMKELARDSTNAAAHVGLGDILYDTGNWSDAIVHYKAALRRDSTLVTAIVDLGVCYYNLSVPGEAERLFRLALSKEPRQPIALFNMGIVHERRNENAEALRYFRAAGEVATVPAMHEAVREAVARVEQRMAGGAR
uniref:Tetratricopeptide repeat protein n=1 Tax=Eiseniibacteriota bacterium TaxID=2212470 RepID=A0A832MKD7_UNCEI